MSFQFGLIDNLDFVLTFWCFIVVIAAIVVFEYVTGVLDFFLTTRPVYGRMVEVVYKELTFMGLVSLAVILYGAGRENMDSHEEDVILSIDFAHITLFFMTIFFVVHAFYLMLNAQLVEGKYRQFHCGDMASLVVKVEEKCQQGGWHEGETCLSALRRQYERLSLCYPYLPFSSLRSEVEFNTIRTIFESTYLVPTSFKFSTYLSGCFARFALRLVNRSVWSWLALIVLLLANVGRVGVSLSCHSEDDDDGHGGGHRRLSGSSSGSSTHNSIEGCNEDTITYFLFCGAVLMLYIFLLAVLSRFYIIRFMSYTGVTSVKDYVSFLTMAPTMVDTLPQGMERRTAHELLELIEEEEDKGDLEEDEEGFRAIGQYLHHLVKVSRRAVAHCKVHIRSWFARQLRVAKGPGQSASFSAGGMDSSKSEQVDQRQELLYSLSLNSSKHKLTLCQRLLRLLPCIYFQNHQENSELGLGHKLKMHGKEPFHPNLQLQEEDCQMEVDNENELRSPSPLNIEAVDSAAGPNQNSYKPCSSRPTESRRRYKQLLENDMSSIFLSRSPTLYFRAIELGMMFNCFYMAVWVCNMITIVTKSDVPVKGLVQFSLIIPFLFSFYFLAYIIEAASILNAISEINLEVVREVLVEVQDTVRAVETLRKNVRAAAARYNEKDHVDDDELATFVSDIFDAIDKDGSGNIDRDEFRIFLHYMQLSFSERRFYLIFQAIDEMETGDGQISKNELKAFLLSNDDQSKLHRLSSFRCDHLHAVA
eukprot:gene3283-3600_t